MFNTIFPKMHKEGYKFLAISILANFYNFVFFEVSGSFIISLTYQFGFIIFLEILMDTQLTMIHI